MKDCAPEKVGSSAPPFNPPVNALSIVPGSLNGVSSHRQRLTYKRQCRRKRRHSQNSSFRKSARGSALRELEASTGFLPAVFLALDDARVTGEEALALQRRPQIRLVIGERLGKAVTHRAGLPRQAAAGDRD